MKNVELLHDACIEKLEKLELGKEYSKISAHLMNLALCKDISSLINIYDILDKIKNYKDYVKATRTLLKTNIIDHGRLMEIIKDREIKENNKESLSKKRSKKDQVLEIYTQGMTPAELMKITGFSYSVCYYAIKDLV